MHVCVYIYTFAGAQVWPLFDLAYFVQWLNVSLETLVI